MDLALDNLQWLICHKIQANPNQIKPTEEAVEKSI